MVFLKFSYAISQEYLHRKLLNVDLQNWGEVPPKAFAELGGRKRVYPPPHARQVAIRLLRRLVQWKTPLLWIEYGGGGSGAAGWLGRNTV